MADQSAAQPMTIAQIEAKLFNAREHLAVLDAEVQELAFPAVNGDAEATEKLAQIKQSIQQVTADIALFDRAMVSAARAERETMLAAEADARSRHKEAAKLHVDEIVKLAKKADQLVASLKSLLSDLASEEAKIWQELRLAGSQPSAVIVGRRDLAGFVVEQIAAITSGRDKLKTYRPVAATATFAWGYVLEDEQGADNDPI